METDLLWQLIDTSSKVALGVAITLLTFWFGHRYQQWLTPSNTANRRLEILEKVSADVGNINHIFAKYSSLVIESTRFNDRWPPARREELNRVNDELVSEFKKMADAEAKLLMLGEKALEKTLRLYGAQIAHFRKQVYVGRKDISEKDIVKLKQDIQQLREQFYDILSKKYDRLLAI